MQWKINAAEEHKENTDHFDSIVLEKANTVVMSGESARSDSTETVTNRIERRHTC